MTNAEAWFNNSLRPRKPEGSLGRTAQDGHLDSHTAPEHIQTWRKMPESDARSVLRGRVIGVVSWYWLRFVIAQLLYYEI